MKRKGIVFLLAFILFLFLLSSCKQKETTETITEESTNDIFDDVLSSVSQNKETEISDASSDTDAPEESETNDASEEQEDDVEYAAPSCGDSICTYYETFSSCPADCEKLEETTLADYPAFLEDGTLLVVGDESSSTDVITATVIATFLVSQQIETETKLASEITDFYAQDLILIGSPCDNKAIATLLHYTSETCKNIISGQNNAVIKLLSSETNEIIIITGYDKGDTKDASAMLTTPSNYNLNGAEEWINLASDGEINVYFSKN